MVYDRERDRRDRAVYAEHQTAVAAGEKRVLRRTRTGELHSYPRDEIGFTPGRGHAHVSTWWGMGILLVFSGLLFIWGCWMLLYPVGDGEGPFWGALWILGMTGFFTPYAFILVRAEYRGNSYENSAALLTPARATSTPISRIWIRTLPTAGQRHPNERAVTHLLETGGVTSVLPKEPLM